MKKPLRVFHLVTHIDLGGAERVAANIAVSHTPDIEYHVVEMLRGSSAYTRLFLRELRSSCVTCHRSIVPDIRFHFLVERVVAMLFPLRFLWIVLRWRPDVIHTHTETPDMCLYAFARVFPWLLRHVRIVRTIHNTCLWTGQPWLARHVEAFFMSRECNVSISRSVSEAYCRRFGGEEPPVVSNGVAESSQRRSPLLAEGKINLLFAGRFEPQKGIDTLCRLLRRYGGDTRYHFVVAGDGSMRRQIEETGGALVVPPIHSLSSYMSSFDYLLMPSEFEGLSMLSMEASVNRLPVIANLCPGLSDTLPPDWPLAVSGNDMNGYARIFDEVLPHADRKALADEAQAFAREHFTIRRMQEAYEKIYRRGLGKGL